MPRGRVDRDRRSRLLVIALAMFAVVFDILPIPLSSTPGLLGLQAALDPSGPSRDPLRHTAILPASLRMPPSKTHISPFKVDDRDEAPDDMGETAPKAIQIVEEFPRPSSELRAGGNNQEGLPDREGRPRIALRHGRVLYIIPSLRPSLPVHLLNQGLSPPSRLNLRSLLPGSDRLSPSEWRRELRRGTGP